MRKSQFTKLQQNTKAGDRELNITLHQTLNQSKGSFYYPDVKYMNDEEILEALSEQGVTAIYRQLKRGESQKGEVGVKPSFKNRGVIVATFNKPILPKHIRIGFEQITVEPYFPSPLRCNKCQKYGHKLSECIEQKQTCGKCSGDHTGECKNPAKCSNCGNNHFAWNTGCPIFIKEQTIIKLRINNKISQTEAVKMYQRMQPSTTIYSTVAQTTPNTTSDNDTKFQLLFEMIKDLTTELKKYTQPAKNETTTTQDIANIEQTTNPTPKQPSQDHLIKFQETLKRNQNEPLTVNTQSTKQHTPNTLLQSPNEQQHRDEDNMMITGNDQPTPHTKSRKQPSNTQSPPSRKSKKSKHQITNEAKLDPMDLEEL